MIKKIAVGLALVVLVVAGGFYGPLAGAANPDPALPVFREETWRNSQMQSAYELYTSQDDGQVYYREFDGSNLEILDRIATPEEQTQYADFTQANSRIGAITRISGEIDGQKVINWLRSRSQAAQTAHDNWDTWSNAQKDNAQKTTYRDLSKLLEGMADLLEVEGYGN